MCDLLCGEKFQLMGQPEPVDDDDVQKSATTLQRTFFFGLKKTHLSLFLSSFSFNEKRVISSSKL